MWNWDMHFPTRNVLMVSYRILFCLRIPKTPYDEWLHYPNMFAHIACPSSTCFLRLISPDWCIWITSSRYTEYVVQSNAMGVPTYLNLSPNKPPHTDSLYFASFVDCSKNELFTRFVEIRPIIYEINIQWDVLSLYCGLPRNIFVNQDYSNWQIGTSCSFADVLNHQFWRLDQSPIVKGAHLVEIWGTKIPPLP